MLQSQLTKLKDFILAHNSYFNEGYENAVMDDLTGQINNGSEPIFPADDKGNYFYLRLPNDLIPEYSQQYDIADNNMSIGIKYNVILVACYQDGDGGLLMENILTTLGRYQDETLKITKAIYLADTVIMQELAKIKKENINEAMRKLPQDMALCSVHFSFTIPFVFQNLNCIQKPCKQC